ncbi:hypothetical protein BROUX41_001244 [Berkeleyomyces rouxiae]|uniref:uncharacterized protein n=1 Tax=Berkeleyomyces rouxiae TaxID=2035830 RepID=UPI003B77CBBA
MPPLKIHDTGFVLRDGLDPAPNSKIPAQAFAITLDKNAIEDMIRCVQNGKDIKLLMGKLPTLSYAGTSIRIPKTESPAPHDIYFTQPFDSTRKARKIPVVSDLFTKPPKTQSPESRSATKPEFDSPNNAVARTRAGSGGSKSPNLDSDLETPQNSMARPGAARSNTATLGNAPPTDLKNNRHKNQLFRSADGLNLKGDSPSSSTKSASPAVESSAHVKTQSILERNRLQRVVLVHELAVENQSTEYLREKWTGKTEDFETALHKAAELDSNTKTWTLSPNYWKELDVWNYDYESDEKRQKAINNAISRYDKLRLSPSADVWERLNPVEERGKGKCLSRIQANLMKGPMSSVKSSEEKSEAMSRSKSNPLPKPTSKKSDKEKRLPVATSAKKAAPPKLPKSKASTTAAATTALSSTSSTPTAPTLAGKRSYPLSSEFITSDVSDDESPPSVATSLDEPRVTAKGRKPSPNMSTSKSTVRDSPSKPRSNLPAKPPVPSSTKPLASPTKASSAKSNPKLVSAKVPTKTAKPTTAKRHREEDDDDDSSSSGTPLSKRHKAKAGATSAPSTGLSGPKNRPSEPLRISAISSSTKKAGSPLARNSPTSVSESSEPPSRPRTTEKPVASKKRPLDLEREPAKPSKTVAKSKDTAKDSPKDTRNTDERKAKRPRAPSEELINKAARFKLSYERYAKLHAEVVKMENPSKKKVDYLTDLREKLKDMKSTIYHEHLLSYNS